MKYDLKNKDKFLEVFESELIPIKWVHKDGDYILLAIGLEEMTNDYYNEN
jgi:hypothetical protein